MDKYSYESFDAEDNTHLEVTSNWVASSRCLSQQQHTLMPQPSWRLDTGVSIVY